MERRSADERINRMATIIQFNKPGLDLEEQEGSIRRKAGSNKLYVDFYYYGTRITKSTGLSDTIENRNKARKWLDDQLEKINAGAFRFAEAFPGASAEEKKFFSEREGWDYSPEPQTISFGDYVEKWMSEVWTGFDSETKKEDYKEVINVWLLPYFQNMTFRQITRVEIRKFAGTLKWRSGKSIGQKLSRSRINNILLPLRAIWDDGCDEYQWDLPDPFRFLSKYLPKKIRRPFEVFRFDEWMRVVENFDLAYRNIAEIMLLTGMIASEIAGLRREDIHENKIHIVNSISRKREKSDLKTPYRIRTFPITNAVRKRVDLALANAVGKYLFSAKHGGIFEAGKFRRDSWRMALEKAGVPYRKPYITRHSFAAWSLAIGLDKNRLVSLMGHGSKQMIYEVYGKYVEGLEKDSGKILDYFGRDFVGLQE